MKIKIQLSLTALSIILSSGCNTVNEQNMTNPADAITEEGIANHVKALASDEFLGRKPFTEGEEKTINYIKNEFEKLGLQPGNNGSYFQDVPMVEINAEVSETMTITDGTSNLELDFKNDFVTLTRRVQEQIAVEGSEMVFVGFGIIAREYDWNDYEGLDVTGKTVVMLVNDPGFGGDDETFFKANTMTYYGRWTYKYEEAARQGAEGAIIIHETDPAGYPWAVVETGWTGAQLYLNSEDNNMGRCAVEGWITSEAAAEIFKMSGKEGFDYNTEARNKDFTPFSMGLSVSVSLQNTFQASTSKNVLAVAPGSSQADEYIIYSAHWDHMGVGDPVDGDSIWNGAVDNATGVAFLIEIAKVFTQLEEKQNRSILFLAVTAEEQGLLGSAYYAENPVFPVTKTAANINMDALIPTGKMKDLTIIGHGHSEMDDYAKEAAEKQGRYILPDTDPGKGYFFRSDHFNFAKVGIPALYAEGTYEQTEKGIEWAKEQRDDYTANRYHKPFDEYDSSWDLSGAVMDTRLFFEIGYKISNQSTFPQWKVGSEFKAKRDKDMANAQ